jgi:hypothetical protein
LALFSIRPLYRLRYNRSYRDHRCHFDHHRLFQAESWHYRRAHHDLHVFYNQLDDHHYFRRDHRRSGDKLHALHEFLGFVPLQGRHILRSIALPGQLFRQKGDPGREQKLTFPGLWLSNNCSIMGPLKGNHGSRDVRSDTSLDFQTVLGVALRG